ncbi:MAG: M23 family metallopeptidase, partial [Pygmaiobacter massiliensis]|nr:M23 family metallopeptidase [Pygmaiobacter massiliensis]
LTELDAKQEAEEQAYAAKLAEYNAARAQAEAEMGQSSGGEFVGGSFGWPVPGFYNISSPYGWRTLYGKPDFHTGIDIAKSGQIFGATVVSSLPGTVQTVRYGSTGYGYYVIVDHGGGYKTLYGHLSAIYVTPGQAVAQGTPVGAVGSTGNSTGPHLHFEIRAAGQKVDPMQYLKG